MTPARFRECLEAIGWTYRGLARMLDRSEGTVRQWANGAMVVPWDIAAWLERVMQCLREIPPPARNRPKRIL